MLIWTGFGVLAALIPLGVLIVIGVLTDAILGTGAYRTYGEYVAAVTLIVSAPLVYFLGKRLEARPGRVMIDKETGEEVVLRDSHTMFFISMRTWGLFYAILAPVLLVIAVIG